MHNYGILLSLIMVGGSMGQDQKDCLQCRDSTPSLQGLYQLAV